VSRCLARASVAAATVAAALVAHFLLGWVVGGADVLAAILVRRDAGTAALALALLVDRLFLVLVAPGWVLYVVLQVAPVLVRAWARRPRTSLPSRSFQR
jgi:hypothetical protein